ncbi:MAG: carboxypeptidase-like regulatory domain-containing protein [Planctomycetota bacterium]|nr:carboxypeptidase-like regulatory domain-containing protein [Planctomycetota bacterium]
MGAAGSRARRFWIVGALALLVGGLVWYATRPPRGSVGPVQGVPLEAPPALITRGEAPRVPDTPRGRGEAEPQAEEHWFEALTLDEEIADSTPEIIAGRVLDESGAPVAGVWVRLAFDDGEPPTADWDDYAFETEEDGTFLFEELPAKRLFRVIASRAVPRTRDWRKGRPQSDSEVDWVERVVVEGIHSGRRDVRVRMRARPRGDAAWTARIRVIGPDGVDVRRWSYTECSNGSMWSSIEGWVEPEGTAPGVVHFNSPPPFGLIIHGCVDEEYEPLPIAPGYVHGIVPDADVYVVHLKRAHGIRGRVDLPAGMDTANVVVRYAILANGRAEDPTLVSDTTPPGAWDYDMTGTEEDGRFELEGLPPGRVRLIPLPPGASLENAPDDLGMTVEVGDHDVRLPLPEHARIRGTIDLAATAEAEGVHVQVHLRRRVGGRDVVVWSGHWSAADLKASGGAFETDVRPTDETYDVEVWAQGTLPGPDGTTSDGPVAMRRVARVQPGGSPLFVVLQRLPALSGWVVSGDPLPRASTPLGEGSSGYGRHHAGVRVFALSARAPALVRAAHVGGDAALLDLGGDLERLLQGMGDASPPEPRVLPPPGFGPWSTQTDAGGRFHFAALPPGRYIVWAPGRVGFPQLGVPAGTRDALVHLDPATRISGRVRAGLGAVPPGFLVEARDSQGPGRVRASSVVRSDGYFELVGLGAGPYLVTAHHARDPSDPRVAAYAGIAGGTQRLALALREGRALAGHVVDERGHAAQGARVIVTSPGERRVVHAGPGGAFRIGGLLGGTFALRVELPDGRVLSAEVRGGAEDLRLLVP